MEETCAFGHPHYCGWHSPRCHTPSPRHSQRVGRQVPQHRSAARLPVTKVILYKNGSSEEKALVERLKGRPFVLLGINSDSDREKLKSVMAEKGMTWQSWWDGGRTGGPIATRWDVHLWPTIIVLDGKGVIRFRGLPHHVAKPLDDAVDSLLEEMKR